LTFQHYSLSIFLLKTTFQKRDSVSVLRSSKITVFWDVILCSLVGYYWHFVGICCIHLEDIVGTEPKCDHPTVSKTHTTQSGRWVTFPRRYLDIVTGEGVLNTSLNNWRIVGCDVFFGVRSQDTTIEVFSLWSDPRLHKRRELKTLTWLWLDTNLLNSTKAVQVTKTNDRPDLSSDRAPDIKKKTVTVK
jgi:hypothetical protein